MNVKIKKLILVAVTLFLMFFNSSSYEINILTDSIVVVILAIALGKLTSYMSIYMGEKKSGMLIATIGNIPELMVGICSVRYGMIPMAKAALIGSIISNMLLGLGISVIAGGIKYKEQRFNKIIARTNFNMLVLAMTGIIVISALNKCSELSISNKVLTSISVKVSIVLICIYILGLIFSLFTHKNLFIVDTEESLSIQNTDKKKSILILIALALISVAIYICSKKLVANVKILVDTKNISQEFIGIILMPILSNIEEDVTAVMCALDNKINVSLETIIGSSIQIALFVTPLLVILSCQLIHPMTLVFTTFEIILSILGIVMSFLVFQDGKSYWFEGAILTAIYIIITIGYYYIK